MTTMKRLAGACVPRWPLALTALLCVLLGIVMLSAQSATNIGKGAKLADGGRGVPLQPDQKIELAMKIKQPFTHVGVGDLLEFQPFSKYNDPDVQFLLDILRGADLVTADFEPEIMDFDNFGHAGGNLATKEVADDWAAMGIDMVSRANNKANRAPGIWENFRQIERVGIVHAGVAKSLPEARMARYLQTPKGLVGFLGMASDGGTDACCTGGTLVRVTAEQLAQVKAIKTSILARRNEVEVPVADPAPDRDGTVERLRPDLRARVGSCRRRRRDPQRARRAAVERICQPDGLLQERTAPHLLSRCDCATDGAAEGHRGGYRNRSRPLRLRHAVPGHGRARRA